MATDAAFPVHPATSSSANDLSPVTSPVPRSKLPHGTDVRAFVEWVGLHEPGQWRQPDLYGLYLDACDLLGVRPLPSGAFSAGLNQLGLPRVKLDLRLDGRRYRPTAYVISASL